MKILMTILATSLVALSGCASNTMYDKAPIACQTGYTPFVSFSGWSCVPGAPADPSLGSGGGVG